MMTGTTEGIICILVMVFLMPRRSWTLDIETCLTSSGSIGKSAIPHY